MYEWFIAKEEGIEACIYAKQKHSDISSHIVPIFAQFAKYNLLEVFSMHLKNAIPSNADYIDTITDFYDAVVDSIVAKETFIATGVLDYWIDLSLRVGDEADMSNGPPSMH